MQCLPRHWVGDSPTTMGSHPRARHHVQCPRLHCGGDGESAKRARPPVGQAAGSAGDTTISKNTEQHAGVAPPRSAGDVIICEQCANGHCGIGTPRRGVVWKPHLNGQCTQTHCASGAWAGEGTCWRARPPRSRHVRRPPRLRRPQGTGRHGCPRPGPHRARRGSPERPVGGGSR